MVDIDEFLRRHGIAFERTDHAAVFTCEEAENLDCEMNGAHTKNLFLRDRKGSRHFLVTIGYDKNTDLKALAAVIGADKLSFASPERLHDRLGLTPGSVTLLGLINDPHRHVEVIIDRDIWNASFVLCHPLINTATLSIPHEGIETFLNVTGHAARIIDVPVRNEAL